MKVTTRRRGPSRPNATWRDSSGGQRRPPARLLTALEAARGAQRSAGRGRAVDRGVEPARPVGRHARATCRSPPRPPGARGSARPTPITPSRSPTTRPICRQGIPREVGARRSPHGGPPSGSATRSGSSRAEPSDGTPTPRAGSRLTCAARPGHPMPITPVAASAPAVASEGARDGEARVHGRPAPPRSPRAERRRSPSRRLGQERPGSRAGEVVAQLAAGSSSRPLAQPPAQAAEPAADPLAHDRLRAREIGGDVLVLALVEHPGAQRQRLVRRELGEPAPRRSRRPRPRSAPR